MWGAGRGWGGEGCPGVRGCCLQLILHPVAARGGQDGERGSGRLASQLRNLENAAAPVPAELGRARMEWGSWSGLRAQGAGQGQRPGKQAQGTNAATLPSKLSLGAPDVGRGGASTSLLPRQEPLSATAALRGLGHVPPHDFLGPISGCGVRGGEMSPYLS